MFVNAMPRYEILSEEAMDVLDGGWRRLVSELGVEFLLPEAVEYFRAAGQKVEGDKVFLDPEFVLEQVAKAPREFDLQARNPERSVHIGGDHMVFSGVYGPPFMREGAERRDAYMSDFENFVRLAHVFPELDSPGGTICEPSRPPARLAPPRHGLRAADAVGQALHGLGHLGRERARHDRHGRDRSSAGRSRWSGRPSPSR